ncbi:hypothetical protein ABVT39_008789 [Epinephelus coioides]
MDGVDLSGLTPFYSSVLQAWRILRLSRAGEETAGMWVFEEPLFLNSFIRTQTLQSESLRSSLTEAGCTKLGHLMRLTSTSVDLLRERANVTSARLIHRVVEEVLAALPPRLRAFARDESVCGQWVEGAEHSFPSLSVGPAVGEWQEGAGQLLSLKTPNLDKFQDAGRRAIYQLCVKVLNVWLAPLFDLLGRWTRTLGERFSFGLFIYGPKYTARRKAELTLMNFLLGSAKLAIWLTRKNRTLDCGAVDPVEVLRGLLKARLRVEFSYYQLMEDLQAFSRVWAVGGVLCSVGGDGQLKVHV